MVLKCDLHEALIDPLTLLNGEYFVSITYGIMQTNHTTPWPNHATPYHTTLHYTKSHHTIPHHTKAHHTQHTTPHHNTLHTTIPQHTTLYQTTPYNTTLFYTKSYHTIPCSPYHTMHTNFPLCILIYWCFGTTVTIIFVELER